PNPPLAQTVEARMSVPDDDPIYLDGEDIACLGMRRADREPLFPRTDEDCEKMFAALQAAKGKPRKPRPPRQPTLASVAKQASKAAVGRRAFGAEPARPLPRGPGRARARRAGKSGARGPAQGSEAMKPPKYVQAWVDSRDARAYSSLPRRGYPRTRLPGLPWS